MCCQQHHSRSIDVFKGVGGGNKIAYWPKAVFSELKATDSPWDALRLPSEWIFTLGTQLAFGLNGRRLPL